MSYAAVVPLGSWDICLLLNECRLWAITPKAVGSRLCVRGKPQVAIWLPEVILFTTMH
jgi:hypothetical protein